jgi:DNA-dependent RNA polymerase auxiliary subunit epsilon
MKIDLLKKRYFIIIFVSIISILYGVFYNYFENLKDKYLKEKTQSIYLEYKVIYNMHKSIADLIFKTDISGNVLPVKRTKEVSRRIEQLKAQQAAHQTEE